MKTKKDIPPIDKAIDEFINNAKDVQINKVPEGNFFKDTTDTLPPTETATDTDIKPNTDTQPNTGTVTNTAPSTVTSLDALIKPSENYIRMISYVYEYQSDFVKRMAKKKKVKESEIVRIALDYLINNLSKE